jgi:diaminopimelate epimerase
MIKTGERFRFTKMTGSGNDFIIIDNRDRRIDSERYQPLARLACRRKLSVGADGIIFIETDPEVDFKWSFFNADGSAAEMCGNGARCAARFAHVHRIVREDRMAFRTGAGIIEASIRDERVKIHMTPPHGFETDVDVLAADRSFRVHFINTGVPHVVCFVADASALEKADIFGWGRALRYHPRFQPAGTNVNFIRVQDDHRLFIRTYERGVEDETLACGTGSIASALVAAAQGLAASPVEVVTRSGETLAIYFEQGPDGQKGRFTEVYLEGDAKVVYEGELWDETLRN